MARGARRPPHPWKHLPCSVDDLFAITGGLIRGDLETIAPALRDPAAAVDVLVTRHRLGPLLAGRWLGSPLINQLPPATIERIHAARERQREVAARCLALLDAVAVECRAAALPFLVVKGPVLALRCHGAVAGRGYWDLDLLVAERDRARMGKLLARTGAFRLSRTLLAEGLSARFNHAFDYEREGVKLDLHWCMTRLPGVRWDGSTAFARARRFDLAGRDVLTLCAEDELHFLLVSAFADIQRGRLRLQTFLDVAESLRRMPTTGWPDFLSRRAPEGTERICRETLRVLLAALRLGEVMPSLVDVLGGCPSAAAARALLLPSPGGLRGKRWGLDALPVTLPHYAAWWCTSLPFRVLASHPAWRRRR